MDSKRHERSDSGGGGGNGGAGRSNAESPSAPPSPPMYSPSYTSHDNHKGRFSSRRSTSPPDHRSCRTLRNDSPQERRSRRRRSSSRSPPSRSSRRSRSSEKEKDREKERERSRKHSRRDKSRSRSRGRSRSRDRKRSHSRNNSRDRYRDRYRESRRHHRAPSYESDNMEDQSEPIAPQPTIVSQPNAFKNDGSFMEMFKKMQEQMQPVQQPVSSVLEEKPAPPPLIVGKRRGGRILKTGMVAKPKTEQTVEQPKDAWSLYMAEVKKYREVCCQEEDNTSMTQKEIHSADGVRTAPFDPRFPNQNQTRYCYSSFLDFHRCSKRHGEDYAACQYFKKVFDAICPNAWIEKWESQLESGTFPGRL